MKKKMTSLSTMVWITFISFGLLLVSCSKEEINPSQNEQTKSGITSEARTPGPIFEIPENELIYISHGSCYGTCPVYTVEVFLSAGAVVYNGIANVKTIGVVDYNVDPEITMSLMDMMLNYGFLHLGSEYPYNADMPQTITSLTFHELKMTVTDYSINVPSNLIYIRQTIESAIGVDKLIGGTPQ